MGNYVAEITKMSTPAFYIHTESKQILEDSFPRWQAHEHSKSVKDIIKVSVAGTIRTSLNWLTHWGFVMSQILNQALYINCPILLQTMKSGSFLHLLMKESEFRKMKAAGPGYTIMRHTSWSENLVSGC